MQFSVNNAWRDWSMDRRGFDDDDVDDDGVDRFASLKQKGK